jgi:hypothetical protein
VGRGDDCFQIARSVTCTGQLPVLSRRLLLRLLTELLDQRPGTVVKFFAAQSIRIALNPFLQQMGISVGLAVDRLKVIDRRQYQRRLLPS